MLYRVEVREVHVQAYVVEANSKVEAKIKVEGGGGEIDEAHFVYSHTLDPDTWTVEEEKNPDIWTAEEENNTIIGIQVVCANTENYLFDGQDPNLPDVPSFVVFPVEEEEMIMEECARLGYQMQQVYIAKGDIEEPIISSWREFYNPDNN